MPEDESEHPPCDSGGPGGEEGETVRPTEAPTGSLGDGGGGPTSGSPPTTGYSPGRTFGSYRLLRLLGRGGFGEVWEAESLTTGRRLALKMLVAVRRHSEESLARFRKEGRLAASINDPRCVFVLGTDEIEGIPVILLELMQGGTLQDVLNQRGRLPAHRAVSFALDILAGLEAAHRAGIVHRDLKPSNCFLDPDGRVKIGDFGVSRTLEKEGDRLETGFVGTPFFASPEQVRGEPLDFRSDLFSLGATLYALLTGRPPFEGERLRDVFSKVLSDEPTPFEEHGVRLPRGLRRIVLKLLAKDPTRRFKYYHDLRAALRPYASIRLSQGGVGRRIAALLIDALLSVSVLLFLSTRLPHTQSAVRFLLGSLIAVLVCPFLYAVVGEWRFGRTVGKALLGLRVTARDGGPLTAVQALKRSAAFYVVLGVPLLLAPVLPVLVFGRADLVLAQVASLLLGWSGAVLLAIPMRSENGFSGLHDLWSGTRVVSPEVDDGRRRQRIPTAPASLPPEMAPRFGPFEGTGVAWRSTSESLLTGRDTALGRAVWIHVREPGSLCRPVRELQALRPGRLRWLQGARDTDRCWDAYELPDGASLRDLVVRDGRIPWPRLRTILLRLASELAASREAGDSPGSPSLSRVWIDPRGNPRLLEFPAYAPGDDGWSEPIETARAETFLFRVLAAGLTGSPEASAAEHLMMPLPRAIRELAARLSAAEKGFRDLLECRSAVEAISPAPDTPTLRRKLIPLLLIGGAPLFLLYYLQGQALLPGSGWIEDYYLFPLYIDAQRTSGEASPHATTWHATTGEVRQILAESLVAMRSDAVGMFLLRRMADADRARIERAAWTGSSLGPLAGERSSAIRWEIRNAMWRSGRLPRGTAWVAWIEATCLYLGAVGVLSVVSTFLLGFPPLLRLGGLTLQTGAGARAARTAVIVRSLAAWSPFMGVATLGLLGALPGPGIEAALLAASLILAVAAVLAPVRSLPDRIAGTFLVPS